MRSKTPLKTPSSPYIWPSVTRIIMNLPEEPLKVGLVSAAALALVSHIDCCLRLRCTLNYLSTRLSAAYRSYISSSRDMSRRTFPGSFRCCVSHLVFQRCCCLHASTPWSGQSLWATLPFIYSCSRQSRSIGCHRSILSTPILAPSSAD